MQSLTFDILDLLSPVKKERLLISFCTTKFCSSLLKFWGETEKDKKLFLDHLILFVLIFKGCASRHDRERTCDLHQRIKISATILKSSLESASGSFSQRDLR